MMLEDTICASATPPINSPISLIRISGPDTLGVVKSVFSRPKQIKSRYALYGSIVSGEEIIDDVVLVYYQSPKSFTGEDMAEISCHGNPIIIRKIIRLLNQYNVRMAEPGEFSKRAFLNGKIDLTEAEAINHIIIARCDWEVASSIKQMHGTLRNIVNEIRERIILLKADIESGIDFVDQDVEFISYAEALKKMSETINLVSDLFRGCRIGEKMSHGIDLPIVGRPNVGKSSILNLILNKERAIVSDIPGTTRDTIDEIVQFAGLRINLIDTAGIVETDCEIEKRGIKLSGEKMKTASIILMVIDASSGILESDLEIINGIENKKKIVLANKIDIVEDFSVENIASIFGHVIAFSAKTGEGLAELEDSIGSLVRNEFVDYESSFVADIRVVNILETAMENANECKRLLSQSEPPEIVAFEMQTLIDCLSEITGEISPDDVLNSIFSRFCIGK